MGNYNAKNTIAQVEVNQQQQVDEFKVKIEMYGAIIFAVTIFIVLILFCFCCKRCNKLVIHWFQKQINSSLSNAMASANEQQLQSVRTEKSFSKGTPSKVVLV